MRSSLKDTLIGAAIAASLIVPGLARGDAPASPHDGIVDQPVEADAALDAFLAH